LGFYTHPDPAAFFCSSSQFISGWKYSIIAREISSPTLHGKTLIFGQLFT
jgi:hypothetical protein